MNPEDLMALRGDEQPDAGAAAAALGSGAIAGGVLLGKQSKIANLDKLAEAQKDYMTYQIMAEPDYDTRLQKQNWIYQKTGWYFDPVDKEWMFQVVPHDVEFKFRQLAGRSPDEPLGITATGQTQDFMGFKDLFESDPRLKTKRFSQSRFDDPLDYGVTTALGGTEVNLNQTPIEAAAAAMHEINHPEQMREGFSMGSNPALAAMKFPDREIEGQRKGFTNQAYWDVHGERNARAMEDRFRRYMTGDLTAYDELPLMDPELYDPTGKVGLRNKSVKGARPMNLPEARPAIPISGPQVQDVSFRTPSLPEESNTARLMGFLKRAVQDVSVEDAAALIKKALR